MIMVYATPHATRALRTWSRAIAAVTALLCAAVVLEGCTYLRVKEDLERGIDNKQGDIAVRNGENGRLETYRSQLRRELAAVEEDLRKIEGRIRAISVEIARVRSEAAEPWPSQDPEHIATLKRENAQLQEQRDGLKRRHAEILKKLNERAD